MWFKNLQLYRFTKPFDLDPETLGRELAQHGFTPCASQEPTRSGWTPPLGRHGSELVHATNGYLMVCCKRQDKLLPAAVVNEALEEKALAIEEREARKMPAKQRRSLKEEIVFSLLPQAFVRSSLQYAYIAPREGMLVVDAASASRAEELLENLRSALGSLPVIPLATNSRPLDAMTRWVQSARPAAGFELGEECELRADADASKLIRCKNLDPASAEIVSHLKTGMHVSKLALSWQERLEFVLDDKLALRRLRFSDLVHEQADDVDADDAASRFDVDFSIMALELSAFFEALAEALGGLDDDAGESA